ncbi:MAG: MBL fold metallo-hydrolase [Synergistaceae bacterium]|jgi:ribonuclease BN (tRNA processing enzyme)|nr:MBL fold metallo-hydrolase [Synergistaceae bacterium]
MSKKTKVVMLGSGTPNPVPDRAGPCVAVVVENESYLVDFGSNVVRQAEKARRMGISALSPHNLKRAFCTHLHSDHTVGIADLIFTPWVLERSEPIQLFGPKGLAAMTEHTTAAFEADIAGRMSSACPTPEIGYKSNVVEISEGVVYEDSLVKVEAFPVVHPPFEAYGYRFKTADRVVVVSGDTAPCDSLLRYAKGCDILVHEVISATGVQKRTPDWREYHTTVHTTSTQLGEIAAKTQPGTLVLYHQLFMCGENETGAEIAIRERELEILDEIRQNYLGPVFSAKDLDIF